MAQGSGVGAGLVHLLQVVLHAEASDRSGFRFPVPAFGLGEQAQFGSLLPAEAALNHRWLEPLAIPQAKALDQVPALMAEGVTAIPAITDHDPSAAADVEAVEIPLPAAGVIPADRDPPQGEGGHQFVPGPLVGVLQHGPEEGDRDHECQGQQQRDGWDHEPE